MAKTDKDGRMTDFQGLGVAMVTPFKHDGNVDYASLNALIERLLAHGTDYLVVLGTTAETPTLTVEERHAVTRYVAEQVNGRVPLILGVGGNCTAAVVEELHTVDLTGYGAVLSVVPFYNKPSQAGMKAHFRVIAQASSRPVVLYNVPGRTGVNMLASTTLELAAEPNIAAIKEASGNLKQIEEILAHKPERFSVLSGDDGITLPLMAMGGVGVISVAGNVVPEQMAALVHNCLKGRWDEARQIHENLSELFDLLFAEGNPAGIKGAMAIRNYLDNTLRLPMIPVSTSLMERLQNALSAL